MLPVPGRGIECGGDKTRLDWALLALSSLMYRLSTDCKFVICLSEDSGLIGTVKRDVGKQGEGLLDVCELYLTLSLIQSLKQNFAPH